ncbi:MAG: nuclear transport factor 2 family protein [Proteobacteria bacterium]|nr:nuclear transport factor 2 family protein [Pseudomonadota bacterium]
MLHYSLLILLCAHMSCANIPNRVSMIRQTEHVLDDWHDAASKADGTRYFGHMTEDAVFLGTDAAERWTIEEFKSFAAPYFSKGSGWTYIPRDRHITLSEDGSVAWFDERIDNDKMGELRGTGVLHRIDGVWKIAQYNMSFPIPNEITDEVVEKILATTTED